MRLLYNHGYLNGNGKMCFGPTFVFKKNSKYISINFPALVSGMFDGRPCVTQGQHSKPQFSVYRKLAGEDQRDGLNVC